MAVRGSTLRIAPRRRPLSSRAPTRRAARLQLLVGERPAPPGPSAREPHLAALFLLPLPSPSFLPSCPPLQLHPLRPSRPSPGSPTVRAGAPPPARRRAAVISPARPAKARRGSVLRAGRIGPGCALARRPAVDHPAAPGPLGATPDEDARSPHGDAAPAAGHAGPPLRGALAVASGAGGCAGESRSVGAGSPRLPWRSPPPHRGVPAVFHQAPACALGPAAASPGSSSVWRPPGPAEQLGGKSVSRVLLLAA